MGYNILSKVSMVVVMMVVAVVFAQDCGNTGESSSILRTLYLSNNPITGSTLLFTDSSSLAFPNRNYSVCLPRTFYQVMTFEGAYDYSCAIIDPDAVVNMFSNDLNVSTIQNDASCACKIQAPPQGVFISGVEITVHAIHVGFMDATYELHGCSIQTTTSTIYPKKGDKFVQTLILDGGSKGGDANASTICVIVFSVFIPLAVAATIIMQKIGYRTHNRIYRFFAGFGQHKEQTRPMTATNEHPDY